MEGNDGRVRQTFLKQRIVGDVVLSVYLVLSNEAVRLQRFPPAQTDLLLVAAADDRLHGNRTRN